MKHRILAATAAVAIALGLTAVGALPASAHTPDPKASCSGLVIKGTAYDGNQENRYSYTLNGVTTTGTFGSSVNLTIPVPQGGATSTYSITIEAHDGGYAKTVSGEVGPCGRTDVQIPTFQPTPPTCDADGSLPFLNNPPAQNPNGYEFPGQGYRVYVAPGFTGPGTYTLTIQRVGPGFDPAFPNGTNVIGQTTQTVTVLPATGYQSTDPGAPCHVTIPVVPQPPVVKDVCGVGNDHYGLPAETEGIVYSRSGLDIVATLANGNYVFGTLPAGYVLNDDGTATYPFAATSWTDEPCGEKPADRTESTEWKSGTFKCGDVDVLQTRTSVTTTYSWQNDAWVPTVGEPVKEERRVSLAEGLEGSFDCPFPPALALTGGVTAWEGWALGLTGLLVLSSGVALLALRYVRPRSE